MAAPATLYRWELAALTITGAAPDADSRATPNRRDLAYDHDTGTFRRGANGGRYFSTGLEGIRQAINIKLLTFLGEWFLDLTKGVPFFELVLVKAPNFPAIKAELSTQILAVSGVRSITSLVLTFNKSTRNLSITWGVDTTLGALTGVTTSQAA